MTTPANKVEFGISNVHVGTYTESSNGITFGTAMEVPGAVSLSLEPQSEEIKFFADNVIYWGAYSDNGFTGTLEVAKFSDEFKKEFMGYVELTDGGLGKKRGASKPKVFITFEAQGDSQARRVILYNVALADINRTYSTKEESIDPATESVDITVMGINTGNLMLTKASYGKDASGYSTVLTAPTTPAVSS